MTPEIYGDWPNMENIRQDQEEHLNARRREAEEAVENIYSILENAYMDSNSYAKQESFKALEYLAWEAGVLEHFKRLRSE